MQVFMVTGLFAGQHNTKLHGTITDVIYTIVGSALLEDLVKSPPIHLAKVQLSDPSHWSIADIYY